MKLGRLARAIAAMTVAAAAAGCGAADDGAGSASDQLATVCAASGTVEGIDVSEFQGAIDWAAVRASGRLFGIARVSDGTQHVDPTFAANWAGMKAQGMVRGAYQFFRASEDPVAQADLLLARLGPLGPGDLPPMLDVEVTDGQTSATIDARIATWVGRVRAVTGRAPLVYTGPYFWGQIGGPASQGTTLVVADWGPSCPLVPAAWSRWTFWQYADNGHVPGIGGLVDLDRFDGSAAELRALTGAGAAATSDVPSPSDYVGIASTADGGGYWIAKGDGGMFSFGDATFYGSAGSLHLAMPAVGVATTSDEKGYWLGASDGGLFAFGDAPFLGSMGGKKLNGPVVGIAGTKTGYWLVADDGGVFGFGNAFYGSMGGKKLNAPVSGIAATPSGHGYWLVAKDGGVFAFGDAPFLGSMGGKPLAAPVVGIAATPSGHGYWLVAADGGMFGFGDATFYGSMGGKTLAAPVTGMAARPQGDGYWLVAKDGGVFAFGAAGFHGRP
jgi:GH25 family lysozyme M1 (1,4-beta-N-acetylmuramidase)